MLDNNAIAGALNKLARMMELHNYDPFKVKGIAGAATAIERLERPLSAMSADQMDQQRGIGSSTVARIQEVLETGALQELEDLTAQTPPGVLQMMRISGLGPKKVRAIWQELGAETLDDLIAACEENRLTPLKGFGQKTQEDVAKQAAFLKSCEGQYLWATAEPLAQALVTQLQGVFPGHRFAITGALRRQEPTIAFVEIACTVEQDDLVRGYEHLEGASISTTPSDQLTVWLPDHPALRFYFGSKEQFAHLLFQSTGSKAFLEAFEEQYNLLAEAEGEQEIFSANGLAFIPPPLRETAAVLDRARRHDLPDLITLRDIRGIIHAHSGYSDGAFSLEEMARAAKDQGFEYLVISDHSQTAAYAGGLLPARVQQQHEEIAVLNEKLAPFRVFKSIESDILGDGALDYTDEVLATFDLVIASVHSNLRMTEQKAMERLLAAIRNPYTNILGHATGRLLLRREGFPIDHRRIIDACAEHNVVIEINANPRRLDLDWRWMDYALAAGVLLSINPDAHSVAGYADIQYGVLAAQKGGLAKEQNLSSFSLKELEAWLAGQQRKR